MEKDLIKALVHARAIQLFYHYCHNLVHSESFHEDHAFFGAAYKAFDTYYDQLVEYFVALYTHKKFKTAEISEAVCKLLENVKIEEMCCCDMYEAAIKIEQDFQTCLVKVNSKGSLGLQNTVQGMATESDVRLYKMKQRIYKEDKK